MSYLRAVSFISADSGPWDLPALQNYEKLTKEAARIICDNLLDHVLKQTYFFLQERLLWIKAFSSIFGRSEAARLCTVSSIG